MCANAQKIPRPKDTIGVSFVDNQAQIDRAIDVTRAVEGVQGVVNEMSIKK